MNAPLEHPPRLDKASFYRLTRDWPERAELKDGRVIRAMGKTTKKHNRVVANFLFALGACLDRDVWSITACELSVEIGDDVRMPDVVVERLDAPGPELVAAQPVLLVEVLSPSTADVDFDEKPGEYTSLDTVEACIVAGQDEPMLWVWQRGDDGRFAASPTEFRGRQGTVELARLGVRLPMAELFRSIPDPA